MFEADHRTADVAQILASFRAVIDGQRLYWLQRRYNARVGDAEGGFSAL